MVPTALLMSAAWCGKAQAVNVATSTRRDLPALRASELWGPAPLRQETYEARLRRLPLANHRILAKSTNYLQNTRSKAIPQLEEFQDRHSGLILYRGTDFFRVGAQ